MNKSQRIKTEVGTNIDKHLKIKLEQDVKHLEILSLTIEQKDEYSFFNCDYGVLIGRVIANRGVGIPNAKISIFIPIDDEDKLRNEINAIYPYETPRDKNTEGKRYNLLPRVATVRKDNTIKPKQPFGSFPLKEEIITNDSWLEVYKKYYKYSTITNDAGDYMLFGVPIGVQTVHMSVDTTDIGRFSMNPSTMVTSLGYSENLFNDNLSQIKSSSNLDDLPNIETQEITADIIPFCGDNENFDIGITRQDFRIRAEITATFVIFGTAFTDGINQMYSENNEPGREIRELYRATLPAEHVTSIGRNRDANVTEQIFYYKSEITIDAITGLTANPDNDMLLLDKSRYTSYKNNGDFVLIISCNRKKIITDEFGNDLVVPDDSTVGVFSEFNGFITLEISTDTLKMDFTGNIADSASPVTIYPLRNKYKFPQRADVGNTFTSTDDTNTLNWKRQSKNFEMNKIYSISKFNGTVFNETETSNSATPSSNGFFSSDVLNDASRDAFNNPGILWLQDVNDIENIIQEFPSNDSVGLKFGANWINFCTYFVQNGHTIGNVSELNNTRINTSFKGGSDFNNNSFIYNNTQTIAANIQNTAWYARSDLHFTDIIEVPKEDILLFNSTTTRGFKESEINGTLKGTEYRNGQTDVPSGGGQINGTPGSGVDTETYYYKGLNSSDCIQFVIDLGLV